ncbi:MAG: glycoside hydrolase family 127 protein [Armatimonas sp.]
MIPSPTVPTKSVLFPLRDIRLLGGPLHRQQELNRAYLHKLDPDRLLSLFRKEAGLAPKAPPYRGWESEAPFLPGHILGFYMSGASMMLQATGDSVLRARLLYIVDELDAIQRANHSGYALAVPNGKPLFQEIAGGRIVINGLPWNGFQINGQFEPTYTLNKILLGLYQIVQATDSHKAKQVFLRLADWFGTQVVDKLDTSQVQTLLQCEHGSLHESYVDAYVVSGNSRYLAWARRLCHERMLAPLAEGNRDFITYFHANSNIPKYTGFERIYQFTGEERLHRAAQNFWKEVVERRSWVIGGNSANEHFFPPDGYVQALHSPAGPELCNSVNMLRLTEALFVTSPSAQRMDFYERVLFNHILASHDKDRAMAVYYTPLFPGAYRVYSDEFDSMWCCTGTGLEVPGKYAQMIYTHTPDDKTLEVNLFAPSELNWKTRQVKVRQATGFPYEPATTLTFETPGKGAEFTLRLRHPSWVPDRTMEIILNGKPIPAASVRGSYFALRRTWRKGDVLRIKLPMHLSVETLPGSDEYAAFLYGPIVLSGELGRTEALSKGDFWQLGNTVPSKLIPESKTPTIIAEKGVDLTRFIKPVSPGALCFRTVGLEPADVSLIPFFENHFQRYAVYWRRLTPAALRIEKEQLAAEAQERAALAARTVDVVEIGEDASEAAHGFQGQNTFTGFGAYGEQMHTRWRDARDGGWLLYTMTVTPDKPLVLRCTYWGEERGARTFDVLINNKVVTTESLKSTGKRAFYYRDIPLPKELLAGRSQIEVKFQAHPQNTAGGLFGLRILYSMSL